MTISSAMKFVRSVSPSSLIQTFQIFCKFLFHLSCKYPGVSIKIMQIRSGVSNGLWLPYSKLWHFPRRRKFKEIKQLSICCCTTRFDDQALVNLLPVRCQSLVWTAILLLQKSDSICKATFQSIMNKRFDELFCFSAGKIFQSSRFSLWILDSLFNCFSKHWPEVSAVIGILKKYFYIYTRC